MRNKSNILLFLLGASSLLGMKRQVMEKISDLLPMPLIEKMKKQNPIIDPMLDRYLDIFREKEKARVVIANETNNSIKLVYNPNIQARPNKQRKFTYKIKGGEYKILSKQDMGSHPRITIRKKDKKEVGFPLGVDSLHIVVIADKKSFTGKNYTTAQFYLVNKIDEDDFVLLPISTKEFK